jgi:ketosteroid isomerase-like protein
MKKTITIAMFATVFLLLAACRQENNSDEIAALHAEIAALQDRNAIQDMLFDYYFHLGSNDSHEFSNYFTEDAVFEINGRVLNGRKEIQALYDGMKEGGEEEVANIPPEEMETHLTLLNNPIVKVDGDTATARMIWTGTLNVTAFEKPALYDQGREYDKLVKHEGKWLFEKRVIIADGFLPRSMLDTWKRKLDYDITAE